VIVAATAVDGEPQNALPHRGEDIIESIVERKFTIGRFVVPNTESVKPVAIKESRVGLGSSSPASCSKRNWLYGLSWFKERIT
jgi:hypothetical protein